MKKPNLAIKDLKYNEAEDEVYYEMEGGGIFIVYIGGDRRVVNALLSYSDMIDALIEAYKSILKLEDSQNLFIPAKEDVKKALTKAGVNINETGDE